MSVIVFTPSLSKRKELLKDSEDVIKEITNELRLHQKMNKVPEENLITFEDVAQLLEQELQIAKNNFAFIKQLNGNSIVKLAYKKGLSEPQKEILGIK